MLVHPVTRAASVGWLDVNIVEVLRMALKGAAQEGDVRINVSRVGLRGGSGLLPVKMGGRVRASG